MFNKSQRKNHTSKCSTRARERIIQVNVQQEPERDKQVNVQQEPERDKQVNDQQEPERETHKYMYNKS
jgi:hypothetical protein